MNIKFKVGDRVRASGTDKDNIYTGTVVNISENRLYIKRDGAKPKKVVKKVSKKKGK